MEYQKVSSAATFSKKLTNSHSFGGKSIYDGVFSNIPAVKAGSCVVDEDYGEIFGGSARSSIPMLDLPELNERKVSVDVNSSRLDYSKIFGGFGDFDLAASHEQLFATNNKPKKIDTFDEEPRTPAETGSCPNFSEENQDASGASGQSFDGVKQFKMSYHKTNQGRENGVNGTTHIAQLNAVPGYSCLINEVAPSQMTEGDKPSSVLNKSYLNISFSGELMESKDGWKTVSTSPVGGAGKQASADVKFQKKSNQSRSNSFDMSFATHENGLRTHPSKVPLSSSQLNNIGKKKGDFERSVSSKFGVSKSHSSENVAGFCSPPYFDEEVDSNSVAAASAAAVKKAIEEAQAKIRLAKEIMERKKDGLQNHVKLRSNEGLKAEERKEGNNTSKSNKSREEAWDKCGKVDIPMQVFPGLGMIELMKTGQLTPDLREGDKLSFTEAVLGEARGDKKNSTLVDRRLGEMKESEAEELGESGARMMRSTNVCVPEDKFFVQKMFEKPKENGKKLKAVEEAHKQEDVKKLNVVNGACELNECANEPKLDQEVNDQEEYGTKSMVAGLQEETDPTPKPTVAWLQEDSDTRPKLTFAQLQEESDTTSKSAIAGLREETNTTSKSTVAVLQEETDMRPKPMVEWLQEDSDTTPQSTFAELQEESDATSKSTAAQLQEETDTTSKSTVVGLQEKTDTRPKPTVARLQEDSDMMSKSTFAQVQEESDTTSKSTVARLQEETDTTSKSTISRLQEENDSTSKSAVSRLQEDTDTASESTVARLQGETDTKSKSTAAGLEEKTATTSKSTVAGLPEETDKSKALHRLETREKKQRRHWDLTANEPKLIQKVNNLEEYGVKSMVSGLQEEIDTTFKASHRVETRERKQRRQWDLTANRTKLELRELRDSEQMKMRIPTEEQRWFEHENNQEVLKLEENANRNGDVPERGENKEEQEIFYDTESQDILSTEDAEKTSDINVFHDGGLSEKILEEDGEVGVKEKIVRAEENGKVHMGAYQMKEIEKRQKEILEWFETEEIQTAIEQRAADKKVEVTLKSLNHFRNTLESDNCLCNQGKMEILKETLEFSGREENNDYLEVSRHEERRRIMEGTQACREMETETESCADEVGDDLEEKEVFEAITAGLPQVVLEFDKMKRHSKDTAEDFPFEYDGVNVIISDMDVRQKQCDQPANKSQTFCKFGKHVEELGSESEENFNDVEEVEVAMEGEEDESNSEFSDEDRWNDIEEIIEASPIPNIFQEKEETMEVADKMETSQNTEKDEENHSETSTIEEREAEGTMQKEVERIEEYVRELDEVKEKEREREKERIAVERAIREARERAFAEARERAERAAVERATAEARRRAMAEAREKSEKVSAEANDKLSADKSSMEARLKAQRAAVERATAEARERALVKAMSDKAAIEARNQAGKFSGASRDNGKKRNVPSNDSRHKGSGTSRSSGDPSPNHGVTHSTAKSDKVDGESSQRHKAKLERHQRTAERAAKALAEKNMRDLLVQKEQAERNRLAETVDADVKRWSSGKQGNLRALLSTLQYILGPNSGWQPVPLTDLIATTAVKKTYRKATLFVHPDKLQQRGASIQQKYTCEKVFDLLKEAWNKFSAEER